MYVGPWLPACMLLIEDYSMKLFARSFGPLAILAASPLACTTPTTDLPLDDMCVQMGLATYEFRPVGVLPMGSFNVDPTSRAVLDTDPETMLIDDDDLTDDYSIYQEGRAIYQRMIDADPKLKAAVEKYEASDTTDPPGTVEELKELVDAITLVCPYYSIFNVLPENGVSPYFTSCKDRYNESGDGILATWKLADDQASAQDKAVAACGTVTGTKNESAINFWGPVTQNELEDGVWDNIDGFNFSGITVPLSISPYTTSLDVSEWEGVAFWARQASAAEAVPYGDPSVIGAPNASRKNIPPNPRAQDGTSQIGIMIQTNETSAVDPGGRIAFTLTTACTIDGAETAPCFADQAAFDAFNAPLVDDGTGQMVKYGLKDAHGAPADVPQPFCIDYSPVDAKPGEEAPYRNQCWDGFRYMREVGPGWQFFFLPFAEMRQAGWGTYATEFRTSQLRSLSIVTSAFNAINVVVDEVAYYRRKK